ncbi:hypothetical protein ACH42_14000 [Endozoicomonas sp. (ex Bugula neritina AB1)]|nr:hypothetical protein ACH42_14000 [Endozoicomonas sp. (ex Bugula neritina AB1)]
MDSQVRHRLVREIRDIMLQGRAFKLYHQPVVVLLPVIWGLETLCRRLSRVIEKYALILFDANGEAVGFQKTGR